MTSPLATESGKRRIHLLMVALLIIGSLAMIAPSVGAPVAAQPLCLEGTIWSEEEQQCVDLAEAQPAEEAQPTEIPAPTETTATEEEAQPTEIPAPSEPSAAEEAAQPDEEMQLTEPAAPAEPGAAPTDDGDVRVGEAPASLNHVFQWVSQRLRSAHC